MNETGRNARAFKEEMADIEQRNMEKENEKLTAADIELSELNIKNMIYVIRGQQVMIDSDLAQLYQVETRRLNQAVKRNIARFPEKFRFQLTQAEYEHLKSQFVTSSAAEYGNLKSQFAISGSGENNGYGGRRKLPFAFTEQGIAMLSAVLRSEVAVRTSIQIMDTFIEMRKYMANTSLLYERLNTMEARQINYQAETDERFEQVFSYISEHAESNQKIFFDGQIYDAFSLIADLIQRGNKEVILVDGYVDINTLNLLSKKKDGVSAVVYTLKQTKLTGADIKNFNAQYPKLEVKHTRAFHDRFLILDRKTVYHIGASIKDAGKKCFGVNLIQDEGIIKDLLQRLELESEQVF